MSVCIFSTIGDTFSTKCATGPVMHGMQENYHL